MQPGWLMTPLESIQVTLITMEAELLALRDRLTRLCERLDCLADAFERLGDPISAQLCRLKAAKVREQIMQDDLSSPPDRVQNALVRCRDTTSGAL